MTARANQKGLKDCRECDLRSNLLFCDLEKKALDSFSRIGTQAVIEKGSILFHEGDVGNSAILLCSGQVKLFCSSREQRPLILKIAGPGYILGLRPMLTGLAHEVTAETVAQSKVKILAKEVFLDFLAKYPEAALKTSQVLLQQSHLCWIEARRLAISGSAAGRLGQVLLEWAQSATCGRLELRFAMSLTHGELGNMAGLSRETVTRLLMRFRKEKLIEIEGASIRILAPEKLEIW